MLNVMVLFIDTNCLTPGHIRTVNRAHQVIEEQGF